MKAGRIATFDDYLKAGDEKELNKVISFLKDSQKGNDNLHTEDASRAGVTLDGLMEKVGMYVVEKKSVSVGEIEENFQMDKMQVSHVIGQLERIRVLFKEEDGNINGLMDKESFLKCIESYKELAKRVQTISQSKHKNVVDITISKEMVTEENDHAVKTRIPGMWGENAGYLWISKDNVMEIHDGKTILTFLDCDKEYKIYTADNQVIQNMQGKELYNLHYDKVAEEIRKRYQSSATRIPSALHNRSGQIAR